MRVRLIMFFAMIGLVLSSCSTVGKFAFNIDSLDKSKIAQVEAGNLSIFMYEFTGPIFVKATFENVDTGKFYTAEHYAAHLSINFVPPGKYKFRNWTGYELENKRSRDGQDGVGRHFQPFEVAAGETIYIGSINTKRKKVKYTQGKKKGAVTSVLLPFYDPNSTFENVYSIKDKSKTVKNIWIGGYHPELKGKMVTRLITQNEDVTSNAVLRSIKLDYLVQSSKELKSATEDLNAFTEEHGNDKISADPILRSEYVKKITHYASKRRAYVNTYVEYYGEANARPEILKQKQDYDKADQLINDIIKRFREKQEKLKLDAKKNSI